MPQQKKNQLATGKVDFKFGGKRKPVPSQKPKQKIPSPAFRSNDEVIHQTDRRNVRPPTKRKQAKAETASAANVKSDPMASGPGLLTASQIKEGIESLLAKHDVKREGEKALLEMLVDLSQRWSDRLHEIEDDEDDAYASEGDGARADDNDEIPTGN